MKNKITSFWTQIKSIGMWVLGIILGGIIIYFVHKTIRNNEDVILNNKYVAVIMSDSDKSFSIPIEFKKGFGNETNIKINNKQKIEIIFKDDQNSAQQAKIIADELVNDDRCVLIIGNSNSSLTQVTLNSILKSKKTKPTFILPIATADNIISKSKSEKYESILRMVPDNLNQSQIIKRFIFTKINKKEKSKVLILVDEDNPTYSKNLSKNIANQIISDDGNVLLSKTYGNNNRLIDTYSNLKNLKLLPSVIVFSGTSSNGLILIEELKNLNINIPVIFSDGCTVEQLMKKAKNILGDNAYFLSSVSKSRKGFEPTYEPIGKDAYSLLKLVLNSIDGEITRENISLFVREKKSKITLNVGFAGQYAFNAEGNNEKMNFKIFTYSNGILMEVKGIQ